MFIFLTLAGIGWHGIANRVLADTVISCQILANKALWLTTFPVLRKVV